MERKREGQNEREVKCKQKLLREGEGKQEEKGKWYGKGKGKREGRLKGRKGVRKK